MKTMRSVGIALLIPISILCAEAKAHAATDPLWQKALAVATSSKNEFPQAMTETEEVHDLQGKLEERTVSSYKLTLDSSLQVQIHLSKSTKNGADNTKAKKKELGSDFLAEVLSDESDPFALSVQGSIIHKRTKMTRVIDGYECIGFEFTKKSKGGVSKGVAFLDSTSGAPRQVMTVPKVMPVVPEVTVKKMIETTSYIVTKTGKWRVAQVEIKLRIAAKIMPGVVFEGRVTTQYVLDNYYEG